MLAHLSLVTVVMTMLMLHLVTNKVFVMVTMAAVMALMMKWVVGMVMVVVVLYVSIVVVLFVTIPLEAVSPARRRRRSWRMEGCQKVWFWATWEGQAAVPLC